MNNESSMTVTEEDVLSAATSVKKVNESENTEHLPWGRGLVTVGEGRM
jgi:hypothetical protein